MFINISNHASSKWSEEQLCAAREIDSQIEDVAFPNVDPHLSTDEVYSLADELVKKVKDLYVQKQTRSSFKFFPGITVHIMGEAGLVKAAVDRLEELGITCFHSTTERKVVENKDGTKTVTFNFIKFRQY